MVANRSVSAGLVFALMCAQTPAAENPLSQSLSPAVKPDIGRRVELGTAPASSKNMNPSKDLKLTASILPSSKAGDDDPARFPWVRLTVQNTGSHPWFFSTDAQGWGMKLIITDSNNSTVPLNEKGVKQERNALTSRMRGEVDLFAGKSADFDKALGDYVTLVPGKAYKLQIQWTIHMHASAEGRPPLGSDPGLSPTITSNVVSILLPKQKAKR